MASAERPVTPTTFGPVTPPGQPPRSRYLRLAAKRALVIDPAAASFQLLALGIRLQTVASAMQRSRTSLYRLWATQEDFHTDLALYLVVQNDYRAPTAELPWRRSLSHQNVPTAVDLPDLLEFTRMVLEMVQDHILSDPWIAVRAATIGCGNPGELAPLRAAVEQQRLQDLTAILDDMLEAAGLVPVPSTRTSDLALGLWCLADGFATLARSLPRLKDEVVNVDDGDGPAPWRLFAYIARCLLVTTTVPGDPPSAPRTAPAARGVEAYAFGRAWVPLQLEALEVGARLFTDRFVASDDGGAPQVLTGLPQINIANLAREAGVTRRPVYDIWPTSEDLRLDLLRSFLYAESSNLTRKLDRLTQSRTPITPQAALAALVREPNPQQLSPAEAASAFLLDVHRPRARMILETGTAAMLKSVAEAVDRAWPPPATSNHASGSIAPVAATVIALATGANRLLRTSPVATDRQALVDRALAPTLRAVLGQRAGLNFDSQLPSPPSSLGPHGARPRRCLGAPLHEASRPFQVSSPRAL